MSSWLWMCAILLYAESRGCTFCRKLTTRDQASNTWVFSFTSRGDIAISQPALAWTNCYLLLHFSFVWVSVCSKFEARLGHSTNGCLFSKFWLKINKNYDFCSILLGFTCYRGVDEGAVANWSKQNFLLILISFNSN